MSEDLSYLVGINVRTMAMMTENLKSLLILSIDHLLRVDEIEQNIRAEILYHE